MTDAGHYRILERLGGGGMGEVFLAEDLRLHRPVALKMLRPQQREDAAARERLLREAQAASALNHPNIAVIYEVGELERDGERQSFIAMEYVAGQTLAELLRHRPLELHEALEIVHQVADALAEAHARGVVHRDVKPSNVMLTDSRRVKVLDFGLARYVPFVDTATETWSGPPEDRHGSGRGELAGTVAYMSPEQARGREVDARSDIFSLGVVFYELLTGGLPFRGRNAVEVFDAILREEPPALSRPGAPVDAALERIVLKMLAKERERRYASLREVCRELEAVHPVSAASRAVPTPLALPVRTVAVMSFVNITQNGEDEWLGTGIAETVTADLKAVDGLIVIARERVVEVLRKLAGRGVGGGEAVALPLGRELGARFVVTGGFQCPGDVVRVTARVLDVETGAVACTVKLDGPRSGIFELQDRIVCELSAGLRLVLPAGVREADETHVVAAYEAFAKGLINRRAETRESLDRAILFFERAVAFDPGYARAHLQLGSAYDGKASYLWMPELHERAIESFRKAIALRPAMDEAWRELGGALLALGRDDEAFEALERALALDPDSASAHAGLARACFIGRAQFDKAAAEFEAALRLNPQGGWSALQLSHCAALLRDFPRGEAAARRAIELQEDFLSGKEGIQIVGAYMRLGYLAALQAQYAAALAEYERELGFLRRVDHALKDRVLIELRTHMGSAQLRLGDESAGRASLGLAVEAFELRLRMGADEPFTRYYAACAQALLGEHGAALEHLEKAATRRRAYTLARARIEPDLEALRGDPRFAALLAT